MNTNEFDVLIIGAGMVGAATAAYLSPTHKIALIEAEDQAGYHTTGRSAAIWIHNYGPPEVRILTGLSRDFFLVPPEDISPTPLGTPRQIIYLAPEDQIPFLDALINQMLGITEISLAEVKFLVPPYIEGYAKRAALEPSSFDMDVAALHQGYLRRTRHYGGALMLRARAGKITRHNNAWHAEVTDGSTISAPIIVNAAGAWGDDIARLAGIAPIGLVPCRRTAAIIDPSPHDVSQWPLVQAADHSWYIRPEARSKLMVTPCDETPMHAHDVQPDELDIAIGIDRMQKALNLPVRRVEHAWAGLRTFTSDRNLAFGFDTTIPGFFWCVGQGGYGIQTAPAAGQLTANMISNRNPGPAESIITAINPMRFRS